MAERLMELKIVSLGRVYGPVPMDKLLCLAAAGRIAAHDMVRPVGATTWLLVTEVPALAASLPQRGSSLEELEREAEPPGGWLTTPGRWQWGDTDMEMTPMIDVTFQLLIFFMLTHAMANPLPMEVPAVTYGRGVNVEGQQFILIDEEGRYYLGYRAVPESAAASLDALVQEVRENARRADTRLEVIVSGHRRCRHGRVRELVERLSAVDGLGRILLGVEEKMR